MPYIDENALIILQTMIGMGLVRYYGNIKEIYNACRMAKDDFDQAFSYLEDANYVAYNTSGSSYDYFQLTPAGVEFVKNERQKRIPINFNAEKTLRIIIRIAPRSGDKVQREEVIRKAGLSDSEYEDICQQLEDFSLIKSNNDGVSHFASIEPTLDGRQAVRSDFLKSSAHMTNIQTGALINAPVTGGNIQAVASSINTQFSQTNFNNNSDELVKQVEEILDQLSQQISSSLTHEQNLAYTKVATELKQEVKSANPDSKKIHHLYNILGFAGDLDGTIELGKKAFELGVKASPYLLTLGQAIAQLLGTR